MKLQPIPVEYFSNTSQTSRFHIPHTQLAHLNKDQVTLSSCVWSSVDAPQASDPVPPHLRPWKRHPLAVLKRLESWWFCCLPLGLVQRLPWKCLKKVQNNWNSKAQTPRIPFKFGGSDILGTLKSELFLSDLLEAARVAGRWFVQRHRRWSRLHCGRIFLVKLLGMSLSSPISQKKHGIRPQSKSKFGEMDSAMIEVTRATRLWSFCRRANHNKCCSFRSKPAVIVGFLQNESREWSLRGDCFCIYVNSWMISLSLSLQQKQTHPNYGDLQ